MNKITPDFIAKWYQERRGSCCTAEQVADCMNCMDRGALGLQNIFTPLFSEVEGSPSSEILTRTEQVTMVMKEVGFGRKAVEVILAYGLACFVDAKREELRVRIYPS